MNNWKTFIKFAWLTAGLMILVLFWDHYILKANTSDPAYILAKTFTIVPFILMGFYTLKVQKVTWQQDAYGIMFYLYSLYGMAAIDMTYSFSFIEAFFVCSLGMRIPIKRYVAVSVFGFVGLLIGHYYATEPIFVAVGQSYKPSSLTVTIILWLVTFLVHFMVTRQQAIIQELNERFALVGKQSSFLMHEIKNPLSRVVANAEESITAEIMNDIRRDSQKISALVQSVEILIHDPQSLSKTFDYFDWNEVCENLNQDYDSYLSSMNIKFDFSELKGRFYGNKSLMYQLLRNSIVNAIEAIGFRNDEISEIKVTLKPSGKEIILTISNTNSTIPHKDLERIFEPHFTTKKTGKNKGLGLALTKSIVEAHSGKIKAFSEANKTSFEITLPEKAYA